MRLELPGALMTMLCANLTMSSHVTSAEPLLSANLHTLQLYSAEQSTEFERDSPAYEEALVTCDGFCTILLSAFDLHAKITALWNILDKDDKHPRTLC